MAMVRKFERGEINIARLNYTMIILIPKEKGAKSLRKFRPISLLTCSFKFFAKALNNRLQAICDRFLSQNQNAFIKVRYILESVIVAHKISHATLRYKNQGLILKLEYEKAYDRVSWHFHQNMMESRGFGPSWRGWVMSLV
jgi:hypothetical protein